MDSTLVHPKETRYFWICAVFSALIYLLLIVSIIGIFYILLFAFLGYLVHGLMIGELKGNSVKVGPQQFPHLNTVVGELAGKMGMAKVPTVYVTQSGGILNAFATRFAGRDFMIINSEVLELATLNSGPALDFIVAHEMGHLHLGHLKKRLWLYPALLIPFLGTAYYRACEYSSDRYGKRYAPEGSPSGLLVLAAGKHLYRDMDVSNFMTQAEEPGFFVWLAEKMSTHPNLSKRVKALMAL